MALDDLQQALRLASAKSSWKGAVRTVATANITLSGLQTLAGVTVVAGDRVLVAGQTDATQNGPYVASGGVWWRGDDFSTDEMSTLGATVLVMAGTYAGTIWQLTSPTTGSVRLGVTEFAWGEILMGATQTQASVQSVLSAGGEVQLTPGTSLRIDEAGLDFATNSTLHCPDGIAYVELTTDFDDADGVADPDDRTVSLFRARGTLDGVVSTTLSETANQGDKQIKVTSATLVAAGMRLRLQGDNSADQWAGESDAEILIEHVVVDASYVSGTTVPLTRALGVQHAIGKPVLSEVPARNITIAGIEFIVDPDSKTVPVGIELTNAVDVKLNRIKGRGFSRMLLDAKGSEFNCPEITCRGASNGAVYLSTCQHYQIGDINWTGEYGRVHPVGIPRRPFTIDDHCVNGNVNNVWARTAVGGAAAFGGINCRIGLIRAHDIDCSEIRSRDPEYSGGNSARVFGYVWHGGAAELPDATFGEGCMIGAIHASAVTQPSLGAEEFAVYLHDHQKMAVGDILIENLGDSPQTAGHYMNGVLFSDFDGHVGSILVRGSRIGVMTQNFTNDTRVESVQVNGAAGEGASGTIGLMLDNHNGANYSLRIGFLQCYNTPAYLYFGSEWPSAPDEAVIIDRVEFDGFHGTDCQIMAIASGAPGDIVRIASGGASVEATGPYRAQAVLMNVPVNGYAAIAHENAVAKHSGTAAVKGDILEAANDGTLVVNNSPSTPYTAKWIAHRASGGGYVSVRKAAM